MTLFNNPAYANIAAREADGKILIIMKSYDADTKPDTRRLSLKIISKVSRGVKAFKAR